MDITAGELRGYIEKYLNARIRPKAPNDRTRREEAILQTAESLAENLLQQEEVKQRQEDAALDSLADLKLTDLLRISNEKKRLQRLLEGLK